MLGKLYIPYHRTVTKWFTHDSQFYVFGPLLDNVQAYRNETRFVTNYCKFIKVDGTQITDEQIIPPLQLGYLTNQVLLSFMSSLQLQKKSKNMHAANILVSNLDRQIQELHTSLD